MTRLWYGPFVLFLDRKGMDVREEGGNDHLISFFLSAVFCPC